MTKERVCANSPAMSRRTLLTALPASGVALALPASASQADPIMPLYRQWCIARAEWIRLANVPGNEDWDCPESIDAYTRESKAFLAMTDMTPISLEGVAALAHVVWEEEGPTLRPDHPEYPEQCEEPINKMILAIWRASSGQDAMPPRSH